MLKFSSRTVCYGLELSSCGMPITILLTMARTVVEVSRSTASEQEQLLIVILSAVACEVLARRIVHLAEPDRLATIMSTRYRHRQVDGDASEMASALEVAIDQHWYVIRNLSARTALKLPLAPSFSLLAKLRKVSDA